MRQLLLVDDDPCTLKLYKDRLSHMGDQVATAPDGLAAVQALRSARPDLVVLDLMMPRLSGADVLKFIRAEPRLKSLPVIVLSNSYMQEVASEAAALGVDKALLKIRCSPQILSEAIEEVLAGKPGIQDLSCLLAVPEKVAAGNATPAPAPAAPAPLPAPPIQAALSQTNSDFHAKARRTFLDNGTGTCAEIRRLCQAVVDAPKQLEQHARLQDLSRKIHFVAAAAGLAECFSLAQMTAAFEALLLELVAKPADVTPSILRTITATADFMVRLFEAAKKTAQDKPITARALAVDDDLLSSRLLVNALERAQIPVRLMGDPLAALQCLQSTHYDLILLDIEMPGMDGFEFCRKLRQLPGYADIPVIFVTSRQDFESRAQGLKSGGNDLISKPVFPMELAVKAVAHLLARQLPAA